MTNFKSSRPKDQLHVDVLNSLDDYVTFRLSKLKTKPDVVLYLGVKQRHALNRLSNPDIFDREKPSFIGIPIIWVELVYHRKLFLRTS